MIKEDYSVARRCASSALLVSKAVMCAETYSHLGPRGRIHHIERDVEKERTEVIVKFKANVLGAQSTVALFGWDFKELRLGCSNKERRVVKQQYDERLSAAKVAWEAAKHDSKSAFRAAERACEAAAPRRLGRTRRLQNVVYFSLH